MQTAAYHVSCDEVRARMDTGEVVVVDARSPMAFAHSHLPGAINLPAFWVDERAPRRVPDPDTEIVVYCESADCDSSVAVANRLIDLGYRNVGHYAEGQRGWVAAGHALEDNRSQS